MSIHTILSQEIEKMDSQLEELFNLAGFAILAYLKKEITEEERNALLDDWNTEAQKHYRSFATRIVEEAQREERSRAEKAEKLLDDVCIIYQKHEDDLSIMDEVRDLMRLRISEGKDVSAAWRYVLDSRTKLQKMKI